MKRTSFSLTETVTIHQMVCIVLFFIFTMTLTIAVFIYRCVLLNCVVNTKIPKAQQQARKVSLA